MKGTFPNYLLNIEEDDAEIISLTCLIDPKKLYAQAQPIHVHNKSNTVTSTNGEISIPIASGYFVTRENIRRKMPEVKINQK
jgi:hypothetical protein